MVQPLTHEEAHAPQLNFTTRTLHFSLNTTFIPRYIPDPDFSWEKYTYRNLDSAHNVRPEDSTTASGQILRPCFFAPTFGSLCCGRQARCRHHACSCRREARAHSCSSANPPLPLTPLHFSTFKQHYSRFALRFNSLTLFLSISVLYPCTSVPASSNGQSPSPNLPGSKRLGMPSHPSPATPKRSRRVLYRKPFQFHRNRLPKESTAKSCLRSTV